MAADDTHVHTLVVGDNDNMTHPPFTYVTQSVLVLSADNNDDIHLHKHGTYTRINGDLHHIGVDDGMCTTAVLKMRRWCVGD